MTSATTSTQSATLPPTTQPFSPLPAAPADGRTSAMILNALEIEIVGLESSGAGDTVRLARAEAEAREAERRATSASEQLRARRLLRQIERTAKGRSATTLPAALAGTTLPGNSLPSAALAGTTLAGATNTAASSFARLAQYESAAPAEVDCGIPAVTTPAPAYQAPAYQAVPSPIYQAPVVSTVPATAYPVMPYAPTPTPRHYVNLDALGWWVKGDSLPALVTTSPIGTPQTAAGVLGQPDTTVLFGNEKVNDGIRPGGRVQGGVWLDPLQTFAVEGHYYALASTTASFNRTSIFSDGTLDNQILARPFFDSNPAVNAQTSRLVAFPDFVVLLPMPIVFDIDGSIAISEYSRIQSAAGGGRYALNGPTAPARLFLVGGYRFFELSEGLKIIATYLPPSTPIPPPFDNAQVREVDRFTTKNTFNGGEIGGGAELTFSRFSLGVDSRLALGNMHQVLEIDGSTSAIAGPYTASFEGGLLAQPSNIGNFSRDRFALLPSLDVKLGFQVAPAMRLTVGYNFTYVTNVIRPGDQIDTNVNSSQFAGLPLVGPAQPAVLWDETSIWLQGVTAGFDLRF